MAFKLVITKSGYNALTETNTDHITYSSDYNTLKYYLTGSLAISLSPSTTFPFEQTVSHNLGIYPVFQALTDGGEAFTPRRYYGCSYTFADFFGYFRVFAYCSTSELIFRVDSTPLGGSTTLNIKYKLFRNNLDV